MRIKITEIHKTDEHHQQKDELVGLVGKATNVEASPLYPGYSFFIFYPDKPVHGSKWLCFLRAKFKEA